MDSIAPEHTRVMEVADLTPREFPTFGVFLRKDDANLAKQNQYMKDGWTIYFIIGYSKFIHDEKNPALIKAI
eukprot:15331755-Ditylum_brightwellii.AAC.1